MERTSYPRLRCKVHMGSACSRRVAGASEGASTCDGVVPRANASLITKGAKGKRRRQPCLFELGSALDCAREPYSDHRAKRLFVYIYCGCRFDSLLIFDQATGGACVLLT